MRSPDGTRSASKLKCGADGRTKVKGQKPQRVREKVFKCARRSDRPAKGIRRPKATSGKKTKLKGFAVRMARVSLQGRPTSLHKGARSNGKATRQAG